MIHSRISIALFLSAVVIANGFADPPGNLRDENLIAWCIVPFDAKDRSPAQRAEMVRRLGLRRVAYDWRDKHVATFEDEILEYKKQGIEYFAFWGRHDDAFRLFAKYDMQPQIWNTLASPSGETQAERVKAAATQLMPLVKQTETMGSKLGLYNHGGWGGEPENMLAVCEYLREHHDANHVGIVYNLHHGHDHIDDFPKIMAKIKPYLLCLNLNGMTRDGESRGQKILPLGEGEFDVQLVAQLRDSGYDGPIGIIGHTQDDVELRLRDNLDGLHWILPQIDGNPAGPKPELRTFSPQHSPSLPATQTTGSLLENRSEIRRPPITVQCRVTLPDANGYSILVASDQKQSGRHWEIFSNNGNGLFTAYLPGSKPDHVRSSAMICDGQPHTVAMIYEPRRVRLFVDGKVVADQQVESLDREPVPGGLGIGRLVDGGLGCRGQIEWVQISRGAIEIPPEARVKAEKAESTLLLWRRNDSPVPKKSQTSQSRPDQPQSRLATVRTSDYSAELVSDLVSSANRDGDLHRGLLTFADANSACISCHRIGEHGGTVGPDLSEIGKQRKPRELVESVLWPKRHVKPEYVGHLVIDESGRTYQGYLVSQDDQTLVLREPTSNQPTEIPVDEIAMQREVGTLMPDNLTGALSDEQLSGLLRFLFTLGTDDAIAGPEMETLLSHATAHVHGPAKFTYDRRPLNPEQWPSWQHPVNRDRVYDFYTKQAAHFAAMTNAPPVLAEYPGLDGGEQGHWGNQNEDTWANDRWNQTDLGSVMSGVFRGGGVTVPRGVCVRLGGDQELATCFNPETLEYEALWSEGFVKFSSHRHGFLDGIRMDGDPIQPPAASLSHDGPIKYRGYYRNGKDVVFTYRIGTREYLDKPCVREGRFVRDLIEDPEHAYRESLKKVPPRLSHPIETPIRLGDAGEFAYTIDHIGLPYENPWKALVYCGGHAFNSDGSALVCTMQGDVWHVSGFQYPSETATWHRFASGLHHPLGMVADKDGIFVLCRDQITRLHDLNSDGEADFYECFSSAFETSPAGHDFICGMQRDDEGNFYIASGNQGLVRISPDGQEADVIATGFRNPDGLGILPNGTLTVPCSEGSWTPASMICAVPPRSRPGVRQDVESTVPHYGYRGPRDGRRPELPLAYLPRGLDNSSGGQVYVSSDSWGPLQGQLVHLSFGTGRHFLVLRDEVNEQLQGAVVPLAGEFLSGAHRGRFHPGDGQLYVTGMQGWGTYTPDDGCFDRVRFRGGAVQMPTGFHVHENGIKITFALPLDDTTAGNAANHFAQAWNYRYGPGYGSPEFSPPTTQGHGINSHGIRGHGTLPVSSAHVLANGRTLFVEIPEIQPVNQLHLRLESSPGQFHELFATVHELDKPFSDLPNYTTSHKTVNQHPMLSDLAMVTRSVPNPLERSIEGARVITIETGTNLSYATRSLRVHAGEPIALTLSNSDVVPHNWALAKPGTLDRVGMLADHLISDPEAALHHYIPSTTDVLAYTNVVLPNEKFTIYFHAPLQPGHYPYLCTFPGHWKVMNGMMIVE